MRTLVTLSLLALAFPAAPAHAQDVGFGGVVGVDGIPAAPPAQEAHVIELTFRDGDTDVRIRIRDGEVESVSGAGAAVKAIGRAGNEVMWKSHGGEATLTMKDMKIAANVRPKSKLGVLVDVVPEALAHQLGVDTADTMMINSVNDGGAAEHAGLRQYDVVVGLDGTEGASRSRLRQLMCEKEPGTELEVTVLRCGERLSLDVILEPELQSVATVTLGRDQELSGWYGVRLPPAVQWVGGRTAQTIYRTDSDPADWALSRVALSPDEPDLADRLRRLEAQMNRLEALLKKVTDK